MKARVDGARCVGCGICMNICPEGITLVNGKAVIKNKNAGCLKDAANACPRRAILFDENRKQNKFTGSEKLSRGSTREQGRQFGGRGMGQGRGRMGGLA